MEEKKKGKGVKVFLAIFIILFLLAALALGYGYTKYKDLKNENTNLNTKLESTNKDLDKTKSELTENKNNNKTTGKYIEKKVMLEDKESYNIYAISNNAQIIGYNDEIYVVSDDLMSDINKWSGECLTIAKFKNNIYNCEIGEGDDSQSIRIEKTDIKESDVYSANVTDQIGAGEGNIEGFIVYNSGKVIYLKNINSISSGITKDEVFTSYKVKEVQEYCAEKQNTDIGKRCAKRAYKLTLMDNTVKEVTDLK